MDGVGPKRLLSVKSVTFTYNDEILHSDTLPKEDQKNI